MKKRIITFIFFCVVVPLFLLLIAEAGLRLFIHIRYGVPGKSYGTYIADRDLIVRHRPDSYNTFTAFNNLGFRNIEDIALEKKPGGLRIYCSGASTTFCQNLPTEESWPHLLQEKLRTLPGHENDEVINAGIMGVPLAYEFKLARQWIPLLKPDYVIFYGTGFNEGHLQYLLMTYGSEDLDELLQKETFGIYRLDSNMTHVAIRHSIIAKAVDHVTKNFFFKKRAKARYDRMFDGRYEASPHPWIVKNFDAVFRAYLAFLKEEGCTPVIVGSGDTGVESWYFDNFLRTFNRTALEIGEEERCVLADFAGVAEEHPRREGLFMESHIHMTREGTELLSDVLLDVIIGLEGERPER
jgi:hypothetical protein